ncbi:SAM-dependent DNA methyltransferase [Pseudoalteromonas sp. MMG010]|uniref:N-6 DNA methylase n=1 Tax=Pseudoalteromonas sp. MMG010 TaxID=2822685 RepID=UPI001B3A3000|nr:N-6 DNA methylase [Pseudoalteromonas sp. MMG010]MBQ4832984.1 SAM-dependent DNA methyltransferase [Pseudoalteromonas sp. MMG010]
MNSEVYAKVEGFRTNAHRKKRLGQVFSGPLVAKFLAYLSQAESASSIIDPMAGSGDMLAACIESSNKEVLVNGIEIDPIAYNIFQNRFPCVKAVLGSAFDLTSISKLDSHVYDLVITNPPYVRYQELTNNVGKSSVINSSVEIRKQLLQIIDSRKELDSETKNVFKLLVEEYSGLSDLAVPSWLLSCLLCKVSGRIAVVLPESWISRDYSGVIHYLLLRLFDIEYIVEDLNSAWFKNVQVKTSLLVAKKKKSICSLRDYSDYAFTKISLPKETLTTDDLVGNLYPDSDNASADFASDLHFNKTISKFEGLTITRQSIGNEIAKLYSKHKKSKWFLKLESSEPIVNTKKYHSQDITYLLENHALNEELISLETLGVSIGQGLRTGANDFFYVDKISSSEDGFRVKTSKRLNKLELTVPEKYVKPVLRYQSELTDTLTVKTNNLSSLLIYIQNSVTHKDFTSSNVDLSEFYSILPSELDCFIECAENTTFGLADKPKNIVELSAVKPNIRKFDLKKNTPPRFWYMLPALAKRHLPDILIPRVNNNSPCSYLCENGNVVVDANFSTIKISRGSSFNKYSLFAILNSSWVKAYFELNASVMGGGALKLEASHIKKVPIPRFTNEELISLTKEGKELAISVSDLKINKIDEILIKSLQKQFVSDKSIAQLKKIVSNRRMARKRK